MSRDKILHLECTELLHLDLLRGQSSQQCNGIGHPHNSPTQQSLCECLYKVLVIVDTSSIILSDSALETRESVCCL